MNWLNNATLKKYWFNKPVPLIFLILIGWLGSISSFFLSLMTGWYFDLVYQESISKTYLLDNFGFKISEIREFFIWMGFALVVKFSLHYFERHQVRKRAESFVTLLTRRLYKKQLHWSPDLFSKVSFGKYLLRYSGDLNSIKNLLTNGIQRSIKDSLFILTGLALLIYLNAFWTLSLLVGAVVIAPILWWMDFRQKPEIIQKRNKKSQILNHVADTFSKHASLPKEDKPRHVRIFIRKSKSVESANLKFQFWENLRQSWLVIIGPLLIFALLIAVYINPSTKGSPGELLAFMLVINSMVASIRNVVRAPALISKGMLSLEKIERLLRKRESKSAINGSNSTTKEADTPVIKLTGRVAKAE